MEKINTKSTYDSELVTTAEYLSHIIWAMMFLQEQGYKNENNLVYQDNKSAIQLEINRRNL